MRHKDGHYVDILSRGFQAVDAAGEIARMVGTHADITERKLMEARLQTSLSLLRATLESTADGILVVDRNGHIAAYNQRFGDMWHMPAELLASGDDDRALQVALEQVAEPEQFIETVRQLYNEPQASRFDVLRFKDGRVFERYSQPQRVGEEIVGRVWSFRDVSARVQAEQVLRDREAQYRAAIETAADGFWMTDDQGRLLEVNDAYARRSGYSREELLAMRITDVEAGERSEETAAHIETVRRRGSDVFETLHRTKDGSVWQAEVTVSYWPIADGRFFCFIRDITERKRAETLSRESEERHRLALDAAGLGTWRHDIATGLVHLDERGRAHYGFARSEVSMPEIMSRIHPDDLDRIAEGSARALAPGSDGQYVAEYRVVHPDGEVRWLAVQGRPYLQAGDTAPYPVLSVGASLDITERKQAEAALRASGEQLRRGHALLRALIDSIPDLIFFKDTESVYLGCNKAFEAYCGVPESALIGRTDLEFTSRDVAEQFRLADRTVLASGKAWRSEEWIPFKDGGGGFFDTVKTPYYGPEGEVLGLIGVSRNITERKQAEQRTHLQSAALESAANGIVIADRSGAILWVNAAFTNLTGYTAEEATGQNLKLLEFGTHDAAFYKNLWDTIGAGRVWRGEVVNRRKDGTLYTEDMTITPVRTDGEITHFIGIKQDISARKQLEDQLHLAQKMDALGTLAGGVAHDFNNILGAIIGNVDLAAQDVGPAHPAVESLDEIRKASHRAKELVQRILTFSRQQPQSLRVIALRPAVEETVKLLRASLPASVDLVATFADDTPLVIANPMQIEQVLLNLCTNAWQALKGAVGRIDIRLDGVELDAEAARAQGNLSPGRWARLAVADTGCGMDAATRERIFEPFFTTKPPGQGTGLGLSVVHGIVNTHGGAITVDSHPGKGTTFNLYFPAATAPAESVAVEAATPVLRHATRVQEVLYLDDEEALVFMVTRALERVGYRVSGYTQAEAALAAVRARPDQFDVVVTDLNMPGISGLDVARELARLAPDLPVVLASGYITDDLRAQAPLAGVRRLIYKPNTVEELCAAVRDVVGEPDRPEKELERNGAHSCDR